MGVRAIFHHPFPGRSGSDLGDGESKTATRPLIGGINPDARSGYSWRIRGVENGGTLEEWGLQAIVYDDAARFWYGVERPVEQFERYFYFVNSKLADMSVQPLQYRDRRDLIIEWRNR